jgi:phenylacetate-CoA ligase
MTVTSWLTSVGPKVRYRMGDQVAVIDDPCPCGLNTPRMLPVAGRLDDMLRISGQNVWPSAVEALVRKWAPTVGEYAAVAERNDARERFRIMLEIPESQDDRNEVAARLQSEFKAAVGVNPIVEVVPIGHTVDLTGAGRELKVRRVFDRRNG